jgi:hypothetical protein
MKKVILLVVSCLVLSTSVVLAKTIKVAKPAKAVEETQVTEPKQEVKPESRSLGIGFNTQLTSLGVNSLSVRKWITDKVGIEGILGFSFNDNLSCIDLGGKYLAVIRKESNMKVYGFGLIGIENSDNKVINKSDTNLMLEGGLGVEFFFHGLPNLGFGSEIGVGYASVPKQFSTLVDWIPSVGIHYYW